MSNLPAHAGRHASPLPPFHPPRFSTYISPVLQDPTTLYPFHLDDSTVQLAAVEVVAHVCHAGDA